ncbi:Branched-chain-amino-acid aminotransferase [Acholeplasma hippikon]|uniref:branched-chain-amino-acid transaminase n=2 Tax=Acholeplasma hippikon TaxID=264636 RepID=A0A449BLB0_9MOLU|nr:Branched-chain-amino-acid aminotransferase [Acholeplasma hippikon]
MVASGFKYNGTKKVFFAKYKDGKWENGSLTDSLNFEISALASALQYGQSVFEGLKAYRAKDGRTLMFRVDKNYERLLRSSARLLIPEIPKELFYEGILETVKANRELVPSYESKGALYVRPSIIGTESVLGIRSANEFLFFVVASPVGNYFNDGFKPIKLYATDFDRAAPNGLGSYKAGANYAGSLYAKKEAVEMGYDDCLYLDPKTHTKLDECGASNVIVITHDNKFMTPQSDSILPSITNNSLQILAKDYLKMEIIRKEIHLDELDGLKEFGAVGTAAVISPVGLIHHHGRDIRFKSHDILEKLYGLLTGIQFGDINENYGWVIEV